MIDSKLQAIKPSKSFIELLKVTQGLFVDLPQAILHLNKLSESDYSLIFEALTKPEGWDNLSELERITFITRFDNGTKMRTLFLSVS